jgi:cytoplasmic iron level regulating protein YaaA (DUF328/UPF0246 family)
MSLPNAVFSGGRNGHVLILLPASDTKKPVLRGKPLDAAGLSFPPLTPTRTAVLEALVEVSAQPDATRRLSEAASLRDIVRRNVTLHDAPTATAESVYSGVLYDALAPATLDRASRRRARAWIVIISALWGALRLGDRIPPYRLNMCGRLPGLAHLTDVWRGPLNDVLPATARRGVVVDFRSSEYATAWRPTGPLAERRVVVKVVRDLDSGRGAASHGAKRTRGLVVRRIVSDAVDPRRPEGVAEALSAHFPVDLRPDRLGRSWELHVVESHA